MRRVCLALLSVVGFASAGGLSAAVVSGTVTTQTLPTVTATVPTGGGTTTGVTTTAPATTTATTTAATTTTAPHPATIAPGVKVGGVAVGGLTPAAATAAVREAFARPLPVVVARSRLELAPRRVASADLEKALRRARSARPGSRVPLAVSLRPSGLRAYVAALAKRFDRKPVDARLLLRQLHPYVTPDRAGRVLDRRRTALAITGALARGRRAPLRIALRPLAPAVTRTSYGPVIVIHRGRNRLDLYRGMRFWREFGVATGQSVYPTPLGRFAVVVKWRNPWWYPPASPWAAGEMPVPPGPGNPLGTRWMGLSAPGVGIHGTPDDASIGYSASHGCIRMHIPDAEWLFDHVEIGTTVFVVST